MRTQWIAVVGLGLGIWACAPQRAASQPSVTTIASAPIHRENTEKRTSLALAVPAEKAPEGCPSDPHRTISFDSNDLDMIGTEQLQKWALCLRVPELEGDIVTIAGDLELAGTVRDAIVAHGIAPSRVVVRPLAGMDEQVRIDLAPRALR